MRWFPKVYWLCFRRGGLKNLNPMTTLIYHQASYNCYNSSSPIHLRRDKISDGKIMDKRRRKKEQQMLRGRDIPWVTILNEWVRERVTYRGAVYLKARVLGRPHAAWRMEEGSEVKGRL